MLNIISTGSNYIFMIMCAIYAVSCFTVFLPSTEDRQIKRMNRQERFMFIFHFICYGVLFLKTFDVKGSASNKERVLLEACKKQISEQYYSPCGDKCTNKS